jgi:hypothetical protein
MSRTLGVAVVACLASSTAWARPVLTYHQVDPQQIHAQPVVDSHVLFLNRCKSGCTLQIGTTDSRTDHSDIGRGTLSAYPYGDNQWNMVVACVKNKMSRFNISVTDVDPGSADHFEVMVAGSPNQIGLPSSVGGIADFACSQPGSCAQYIPDALVFDFTDVWGGAVEDDCSTIAQEIAHTWGLDHVADASDPMTYFPYSGMRQYKDNVQCGSDCQGGQSPFGLPCSGPSGQYHICMSSGTNIQNDVQTILKLFGPFGAAPPTLKITSPADGSAQQAGFQVQVTCTSGDGIQEVDLSIDGVPKLTLTAAPYNFATPANLADGFHKIDVMCATNNQATATASVSIVIGQKCNGNSDCPTNDICYSGACIPGPMATGGLGATCMGNSDCASGECASDGTNMYCVVGCDLNNDHCPGGFGCLMAGTGGVCWPGAAHGSSGGGCDAGGAPRGPMLFGLGLGAMLLLRRRRAAGGQA